MVESRNDLKEKEIKECQKILDYGNLNGFQVKALAVYIYALGGTPYYKGKRVF